MLYEAWKRNKNSFYVNWIQINSFGISLFDELLTGLFRWFVIQFSGWKVSSITFAILVLHYRRCIENKKMNQIVGAIEFMFIQLSS